MLVAEGIKVEVRHQLCLDVVYGLAQSFGEFIEVFFVDEDFMAVIAIVVKPLPTLGGGQEEIIISPCGPYVKKIGPAFPSSDALAVYAVVSLVVRIVAQGIKIRGWG